MSKISVIIPVYNLQNYICRCLDSVINQDYFDLEIIVVDDGSTDSSVDICNDYALKDSRIKVLSQQNAGVSAARNAGLNCATGDYIAFIDGDDWAELDMFSTLYNNLKNTQSDLSICSYCIDDGSNFNAEKHSDVSIMSNKTDIFTNALQSKDFGGFLWNKLFKAELLCDIRFDTRLHFCEDLIFVCEYLKKCQSCALSKSQLYHYYERNDAVTKGEQFNYKKFTLVSAYEQVIDFYQIECPSALPIIYAKFLKMNVAFKCRYILSNMNDKQIYSKIMCNIKKYYPIVIKSNSMSLKNKIKLTLNIIFSKHYPNTNLF